MDLKDLLPLVPSLLHEQIRASRHYASNSDSLVIQADSNRKQTGNIEECFKKLEELIVEAGKKAVRGETTPAQVARVKSLYVHCRTLFALHFRASCLHNFITDKKRRMRLAFDLRRCIVARSVPDEARDLPDPLATESR